MCVCVLEKRGGGVASDLEDRTTKSRKKKGGKSKVERQDKQESKSDDPISQTNQLGPHSKSKKKGR